VTLVTLNSIAENQISEWRWPPLVVLQSSPYFGYRVGIYKSLGMDLFNFVIAGSGPAGVAAAHRLEGHGTCIVDVGEEPGRLFPYTSFNDGLASADTETMLGPEWEMLANLIEPENIHTKLRSPGVRYVANGQPFSIYDGSGNSVLRGAGSYAAGGMSNAWGAQLFRYNDIDLAEAGDWPIKVSALEAYYKDLERHIGIAGLCDDMHEFLGETACMLPPAPIVPAAEYMLARYEARRGLIPLRLGRSRLAVLTQPYRGYPAYGFNETEFYSTEEPGFYSARRTLAELRQGGKLKYLGGHELIEYREYPEFVEVDLHQHNSNDVITIRARHLLLGCGTMQTTRLVLLSKQAYGKSLPFIDHPPTLLPLFIPRMFGKGLPAHSFPVQLIATLEGFTERDMISLYYPGALLWSDLLADVPLPMNEAVKVLPNILGGMLVAQIWETSRPCSVNRLSIDSQGQIRIDYPSCQQYSRIRSFLKAMRALGAFSLQRFAKKSPPGWGFHYAGCLPMRHNPDRFETYVDGRLWDSQRVRVIDGSVLPSLPAKNHSLTLMANSARIAEEALRCGY
jgi:choline dehydrogenase-like flavoprotein